MAKRIDREELAWAAGFFDGEGNIRIARKRDGCTNLHLSIGQTEPSTLVRFRDAVGLGKVYGPYTRLSGPNRSPMWRVDVTGFERCQAAVALLWPFLSGPKRHQAATALKAGRPMMPGLRRGDRHPKAKLTTTEVREIVGLYRGGVRTSVLANNYGLHPMYISRLVKGERWAHLWSPAELEAMRAFVASRRGIGRWW